MKKLLAITLCLVLLFSMNIGAGPHTHAHADDVDDVYDIYTQICPNCGVSYRGDECWNCSYPYGSDGVISGPLGWICPTCGESNQSGDKCWNCGYVYGGTAGGTVTGFYGWTCPVCGEGNQDTDKCWNCGYNQGTQYFGSVGYVTVTNTPTTATAASSTVQVTPAQIASVYSQQLTFIASRFSECRQDDSQGLWFYAVTDLDHNGFLELLATRQLPGRDTKFKAWEVSKDGSTLVSCNLPEVPAPLVEGGEEMIKDSFTVNLHKDAVDTYYDAATNSYYYMFVESNPISTIYKANGDKTEAIPVEAGQATAINGMTMKCVHQPGKRPSGHHLHRQKQGVSHDGAVYQHR